MLGGPGLLPLSPIARWAKSASGSRTAQTRRPRWTKSALNLLTWVGWDGVLFRG